MRASMYIAIVLGLVVCPAAQGKSRSIHVFVALCDNEHQGIVPVPKKLGDGDDPANNLYWGALYGTKAFLKRSKDWTLLASQKRPSELILERAVFKHATKDAYLVADAYRGAEIKRAVQGFVNATAGKNRTRLKCGDASIAIGGAADLVVYVGHNGLMEFTVGRPKLPAGAGRRDAIVLACKTKPYFQPHLAALQCRAVLLTTGFMAPEAYTLQAALAGWLADETGAQIKDRAARAYHEYQKCGLKAARRLFYADG